MHTCVAVHIHGPFPMKVSGESGAIVVAESRHSLFHLSWAMWLSSVSSHSSGPCTAEATSVLL